MAAGSWKDWAQGELVTESGFQDIQDSIAFIYASESAANTALTNKVEGTQFYDTGENVLKIWDGTSWDSIVGGLVLLQTATASNDASLIFDDFVDLSTYASYFIVFSRIYSQNDNVEFQVNFRTGGSSGADLTGTYYQGGVYYEADTTGGTIFENNSRTDNQVIDNNLGNGTAEALVGSGYFYPATGTASTTNVNVIEHKTMHQRANDFMRFIHRATFHESIDATTGLKFTMSSGNIASGTIRIYGVKS